MNSQLLPTTTLPTLVLDRPRQLNQVISLTRPAAALKVLPKAVAVFERKPKATPELLKKLPAPQMYSATRITGWISRLTGQDLTRGTSIEIELPLGTPKYVTVKTFRKLLGGKRGELLLKKTGTSWSICEDQARVDLTDTQTEFRLGPVAIYS